MTATFYVGDTVQVMGQLPEKSVDLILSSPPFLALRSYLPADHPDKALEGGSQATPGEYIDWLIDVVEACDRVLAPHGSLCFELGDTYCGAGGYGDPSSPNPAYGNGERFTERWEGRTTKRFKRKDDGWPLSKSLSLIPELFRFTLVYGFNPLTGRETERWRLRNVVRWVRPNPPVGALGDKFRCATSELMVFCKSAKRFFDLDAVRLVNNPERVDELSGGLKRESARVAVGLSSGSNIDKGIAWNPAGAPPLDWWNIPLLEGEEPTRYGPGEKPKSHARTAKGVESVPRSEKSANRGGNWASLPELHETQGAPPLDWWQISPGGFSGAHYAVFPAELCVKPIKAMCPSKVCRVCGEPSRRIVEKTPEYAAFRAKKSVAVSRVTEWAENVGNREQGWDQADDSGARGDLYTTKGFSDCGHNDYRPGLVLDPFAGSGTTLSVATGHGRDAIGIDLDERNYELALDRVGPMFLTRGEILVEEK